MKYYNPIKTKEPDDNKPKSRRRSTECLELSNRYLYRRAYGETQLMDVVDFDYKLGHSYHFITGGDVDSLTFFKTILRQQNVEYMLLSTWCMAAEDIRQITEWVDAGTIKHLDMYLGETFPTTYRIEYGMVKKLYFDHPELGRVAVFKNHSKIFAGYGNKFPFAIQSSANINTNPRTENACITIDDGLYKFYKEYFDGINTIVK